MKYKTEAEIFDIARRFEIGTISRDEWRHAEHLTVAAFYLTKYDFQTSLSKMRGGIFNLLESFGVDLSKEMPCHETLTVFWMRAIENFLKSETGYSIAEICNEAIKKFSKDYPFEFYSREKLFSAEARAKFIEPDLKLF